jgi:hypothetical protein
MEGMSCLVNYISNAGCDTLTFGSNCQLTCGHCFNGEICDHVDGTCHNGCAAGWIGTLCDQRTV